MCQAMDLCKTRLKLIISTNKPYNFGFTKPIFPLILNAIMMNAESFLRRLFIAFGIALLANYLVSVCRRLFLKGEGLVICGESGFRMSLLLAIVISLTRREKQAGEIGFRACNLRSLNLCKKSC
jgi:hypothetical protein